VASVIRRGHQTGKDDSDAIRPFPWIRLDKVNRRLARSGRLLKLEVLGDAA